MSRPEIIRIILATEEDGSRTRVKARRVAAIERVAALMGIEDGRGTFSQAIRDICDMAEVRPTELAELTMRARSGGDGRNQGNVPPPTP